MTDLPAQRLRAQRLTGEPFTSASRVVGWMGAVQAQDYEGAKWALGQRTQTTTAEELDLLFDRGVILRTHLLRPTWHFVVPEDIGWLLELTGPRIRRGLAFRYRQLEIDDEQIARAETAITAALAGGRHLTRPELGEVLAEAGISAEGQRLPHLIGAAELDGLVTSGPRRGKQFTYALLEERATRAQSNLDRDEAVVELARRYFWSHGPAQLQDFIWWSGLTARDARRGIDGAGAALGRQLVEAKEYWFDAEAGAAPQAEVVVRLLPNFDEYTVGYRDRAEIHPNGSFDQSLFAFGSILSNVIVVGGRVRGAWRRSAAGSEELRLEIRLLDRLQAAERSALEDEGRRLSRFLRRPVDLAGI